MLNSSVNKLSKVILPIINKNHNKVPAGIHAYDRACLFCHFLLKNKPRNKQKLWNISTTISYLLLATQGHWSKGFLPSSINWFCFAGLFSSAEKNAVVFPSLNPRNKHNSFDCNNPSAISLLCMVQNSSKSNLYALSQIPLLKYILTCTGLTSP